MFLDVDREHAIQSGRRAAINSNNRFAHRDKLRLWTRGACSRSGRSPTSDRSARRRATLSLTQPAVSQQVAALEREVGARLLDREPGGLRLTPRRRDPARRTPTRSRSGSRWRSAQLGELTAPARLRIGAFPSALAALVPKAAARLGEVVLEEGSTPELAERVRARRAAPRGRVPGRGAAAARARRRRAARHASASRSWSRCGPGIRWPRATRCRSPRSPTSRGWRRAATT